MDYIRDKGDPGVTTGRNFEQPIAWIVTNKPLLKKQTSLPKAINILVNIQVWKIVESAVMA